MTDQQHKEREEQLQAGNKANNGGAGGGSAGAGKEAQQQSPQSLSYHQQQLLHLLHLQRAGGLNKITADLAGVHFEGTDGGGGSVSPVEISIPAPRATGARAHPAQLPAALNLPQVSRAHQIQQARVNKSVRQQVQQAQAQQQRETAAAQHRARRQQLAVQKQQQQQQQEAAAAAAAAAAESSTGSDSSEQRNSAAADPARDAQETADDAAILRRYKILQLVGTGNYARVYRAIYLPHNRELAVKSINLSRTTENYKQRFLPRELSILKRVSHVNICKIYEISQVSDRIFIVMQYCSRGTIADLLQRNQGPFTEAQSRYLFAPAVDALVYLHAADIAHRDVKIENILLDHDYIPKLTDFSFSCVLNEQKQQNGPNLHAHNTPAPPPSPPPQQLPVAGTSKHSAACGQQVAADGFHPGPKSHKTLNADTRASPAAQAASTRAPTAPAATTNQQQTNRTNRRKLNETFCGTLPYLSPEMIRQFPYDPRKTDVWSLGVCLYVMLNDRLPFPFNDIKSMVRRQLARDFKFRANVETSESCRELIACMLEPNFSKRSASAELARHSWMSGPRERPGVGK